MQSVAEFPKTIPTRRPPLVHRFTLEKAIKASFGGNAFVAILVLALIALFLLRGLSDLRLKQVAPLQQIKTPQSRIDAPLAPFDKFTTAIHYRHRYAQHATGRAPFRSRGIFYLGRLNRMRAHGENVLQSFATTGRGLHHRPIWLMPNEQ